MLYDLAYWLIRALGVIFFRVEVEGRQNVPAGGCLVVCNHLSWTDTIFIVFAIGRLPKVHTMANESSVFNTPWKRWLLPRFAVFPVRRNRGMLDEKAVNTVYDLLNANERVMIFPEGAYGDDGKLRPLKDGVGYFALNTSKPILPVSISGTNRLRPFSRVRVVIGEPFIPDPPRTWGVKERVRSAVDSVSAVLARLGRRSAERRPSRLWPWRRRRVAEVDSIEGGQTGVGQPQPSSK